MRRFVSVVIVSMLLMGAVSVSGQSAPPDEFGPEEHPFAARIRVDDAASLESLRSEGVDVTHNVVSTPDGVEATVFLTESEEALVADVGGEILGTQEIPTLRELQRDLTPRPDSPARVNGAEQDAIAQAKAEVEFTPPGGGDEGRPPPTVPDTTLNLLRADWFENFAGVFVSFEVRSDLGPDDEVTVSWGDETITLNAFEDAGQYLYHRTSNPVSAGEAAPDEVTMTSGDGTSITVPVTEWVPTDAEGYPPGFQWGFTDTGYLDPDQINTIVEDLAAQYPDLTEVIELPNQSVGYQWPAQALVFEGDIEAGFFAETDIHGHEGGNDYVLEVLDPGESNSDLTATLDGVTVTVSLATDGSGEVVSTAAEAVGAINTLDGVSAYTLRDAEGTGVVQPTTVQFDDGLDAPESYPRGPMTIKVLRIGADQDGDKPGVYLYSQEHAREWVTPLVAVETANRLLANYGSDPTTTALVDGLDIFIQPVVNPDGAAFSLYDDLFQRTNFARHCEPGVVDPFRVTNSGVDLNRNFTVGSRHDGYSGASGNCLSSVYSGPTEASEPEAQNERWLVDTYDNILFAMNTHSFGGYFMWSPAAYIQEGRVPLPRPSLGTENYFFEASATILDRIKRHRGTVVHPGRTGPVIDVLYSAAGNSGDDHFYGDDPEGDIPDIYAWDFEVGADLWDGDEWESPGFFWPDFETEGFHQAMEFSNGWYGMLEVALEFAQDSQAPRSSINADGRGWYSGPLDVVFTTNEAATIHYTTDGSLPNLESPTLEREGLRDGAAPVEITETTTLRWFAVDEEGNQERPHLVRIKIRD